MKFFASMTRVAVVTIVVACGGSTSGKGSPVSANSPAVTAYAQALCNHESKCDVEGITLAYGDVPSCVSIVQQELAFALQLRGTSVGDSELGTCANALNALDCTPLDSQDNVPQCQISGTAGTGTPCQDGIQCVSGYCKIADSDTGAPGTCGTCQDRQDAGGACQEEAGCKAGLDCDTVAHKCGARLAQGAACTIQGLSCVSGLRCISAVCATPVAAGGTCDAQKDECAMGYECDNAKCAVLVESNDVFVNVGEACGVNQTSGAFTVCKAASCVASKCVAFATEGQACQADASTNASPANPDCAPLLHCDNGKCVKDDPLECK